MLLFQHSSRKVSRRELRSFWLDLVPRLAPGKSATCLITTDAALQSLNLRFRRQNQPTDVLSFPNDSGGEIAISFDRAVAQAAGFGHTVDNELRILMLHGLLHLNGMDHATDDGKMARAEARWRKRLGLTNGLIERSK